MCKATTAKDKTLAQINRCLIQIVKVSQSASRIDSSKFWTPQVRKGCIEFCVISRLECIYTQETSQNLKKDTRMYSLWPVLLEFQESAVPGICDLLTEDFGSASEYSKLFIWG
jgi:hypothetical protein